MLPSFISCRKVDLRTSLGGHAGGFAEDDPLLHRLWSSATRRARSAYASGAVLPAHNEAHRHADRKQYGLIKQCLDWQHLVVHPTVTLVFESVGGLASEKASASPLPEARHWAGGPPLSRVALGPETVLYGDLRGYRPVSDVLLGQARWFWRAGLRSSPPRSPAAVRRRPSPPSRRACYRCPGRHR